LSADRHRRGLQSLLSRADVELGGTRAWDVRVRERGFYHRVLAEGVLGAGESYMDGWWDCERLDQMLFRVLRADLERRLRSPRAALAALRARVFNLQKAARAFHVGRHHYDLGNELYRRMLDRRMIYSCGYWKSAANLDEAQEAKLDLVCRKLGLQKGMCVLDIGCGWGGAARFAAERYQVSVVGITVSENQARLARESCEGLPVEIRLADYRTLRGRFDRIFSLGMFEHVGHRNYGRFMQIVRDCLSDEGLFLLHTIGSNESVTTMDPWIERYIFPNSMLPSMAQIAAAAEERFVVEDWHVFGRDYDLTLTAWWRNFEQSWAELEEQYDERFHRMWRYYLLVSAAAFRARKNQLWQIVLSPSGVTGGYAAVR